MDSKKLFLIQSYHDNWKIYQDSLNQKPSLPFWDMCILTASNLDQAHSYQLQINARIDSGLLPKQTKYIILPDLDGKRIGSGGATLYALHEASKFFKSENPFDGKRILIIHSGGDSKRIPHNSVFGKIFSKIPRELPNSCSSTLFDETFITLSGLPSRMKDGVMIISGDVLLIFNHTQLDFERMGAIGISVKTDVKTGSQHGVYVEDPFTKKAKYFLHKNPENKLKEFGAIDENEMVSVDSGMIWFEPKVASRLLNLINNYPTNTKEKNLSWWLSERLCLNLYGDIFYPLAEESTLKEYFDQASEAPKTAILFEARQIIWNQLRHFPFYVLTPSPAQFIHFGTTKEYITLVLNGTKDYRDFGWKNKILSFCFGKNHYHPSSFHSFLSTLSVSIPQKAIFEDCEMYGDFTVGRNSLLSNIRHKGKQLKINENTVVQTIPLKNKKFTNRIYIVFDNPKNSIEEGTYLNRPWKHWFNETNIMPDDIWDNSIETTNRTLWNAKLFPVCNSRDESLKSILWLQNLETITKQQVTHWLDMQRVSLKESMEYADHMRILRDQKEIEDRIRAELFFEALRNKKPVLKNLKILGNDQSRITQQVNYLIKKTEKTSDPLKRMRYFRALSEVTKNYPHSHYPYNSKELEEIAFQELNQLINTRIEKRSFSPYQNQNDYQWARVKIAARADLGGGWSDTPPFCNEYGGTVLNCALTLNHSLPIEVYIRKINEPFFIFKSIDLGLEKTINNIDELINYKNPSDPLALHKAALFFSGFIP
jgi:fucokinase